MTLSRRKLLAGAPAAAALAVLPGCQRSESSVVNVRKFGATGDGTTDDSRAIQAAVAALRSRSTLHFPRGTYRFAQRWPTGTAAIVITGVSDVDVEFDPGAELVMDNLDPTARTGTSHGVLVRGPASRISLRKINIRWSGGAKRSLGDGIRVVGCPAGTAPPIGWSGPRAPVDGIALSDCVVRASPQAGVVMFGASNITVAGLRVADSGADGLHFNACRRASVDDYRAVDPGDDGIALVTYFAHQFSFDDSAHTFSFPALTDWSNADFAITNVSVVGGKANGVRIAGANRVSIGGLHADGVRPGSAVMIDSAEPGSDVGWNYVASRDVRIGDVSVANCDTGIHVLARPRASGDQRFTNFDVHVEEAKLDGCDNWSVRVESLTKQKMSGFRIEDCRISATSTTGGNGGVGIDNAQGISLGSLSIRHARPVVAFTTRNAGQLAVDRLRVAIDDSAQPAGPAAPCVSLADSDGVIADLELNWRGAPETWTAVLMSKAGECHASPNGAPVAIRNLTVTPPISTSVVGCP